MATATKFFKFSLVFRLLLSENGVDGSRQSCPKAAIVNLTSHKVVKKFGDVFPKEAVWFENGSTFGCPCYFKKCLPLCCPVGYAANADGCVKDALTVNGPLIENSKEDIHVFIDNPCHLSLTNQTLSEKYYNLWPNGSMLLITLKRVVHLEEYCLLREENLSSFLVAVCTTHQENDGDKLTWPIGSLNVSMLFAAATLIVYSITPELKNLPGAIFRCYLASYCICIILVTLSQSAVFRSENYVCTFVVSFGTYYYGVACMMWLNVMSFDIWRKFRRYQSSHEINIKERDNATFVRYSVYAWGGSMVPPTIFVIYSMTAPAIGTQESTLLEYFILWPIIAIAICNTCIFASTSIEIRRRKQETADLVNGVNKHHQENKQWFNLYVKLFIIMGVPLIFWAIALSWKNEIFFMVVCVLEAFQGISIFYTFIWKDDVKRLLAKRRDGMLLVILDFFRHQDSLLMAES